MGERPVWPRELWIVRHGQSAGNAARDAAEAAGLAEIALPSRDVDIPLSPIGEEQAHALGSFFAALDEQERPNRLLCSPYARARRTAEIATAAAGISLTPVLDERLREREFGWLDGLTRRGISEQFPGEALRRERIGKFYHRPPGGESWCDVFLRVRSFLSSLAIEHADARVLVVAHQVVILGFRYLIERMTEEQILAIDKQADIANCAVTSYRLDRSKDGHGELVLNLFNHVAPIADAGAVVTRSPDASIAPR